jgi:hypothetical protein
MSPFLLLFLGNFLSLNYVFTEVASIMGEFSIIASLSRKSVHWLMFDIDLHQLLGADEVNGDVRVAGHYHTW